MVERTSFVKNMIVRSRLLFSLPSTLLILVASTPVLAMQITNEAVDMVMAERVLSFASVTATLRREGGGTNNVSFSDVSEDRLEASEQKTSGASVDSYQARRQTVLFVDEHGDAQPSAFVADTRTSADDPIVFSRRASKLSFSANINENVAVELVRDGIASRSAVAGIQYVDTASGQEQLISWVKSSPAMELNEGVLYEDAFAGAVADVRYIVSPSRLQQDVILYALPEPEVMGMDPETTQVRVLTEIMGVTTNDLRIQREMNVSPQSANAAPMQIFRGTERIFNLQRGYAYAQEDGWAIGGRDGEVWHILDMRIVEMNNRVFLAEEIPLSVIRATTPEIFVRDGWSIPADKAVSAPPVRPVSSSAPEVAASFNRSHRGFVIDYIHWHATITNAVTFETGQTYLITNSLAFDGTNAVLTIKPGAVVKFGTNGFISMQNGSRIVNRSHLLNPAVFTSAHDTDFGELISGYTNAPANNLYETAFELATTGNTLEGIRVRYARKALSILMPDQIIRHCILEKGQLGIDITTASTGGTVIVRNGLLSMLNRGVLAGSTASNLSVQLLNSTMDTIAEYAVATNNGVGVFSIECSLFASVTNQILKSNPTVGYSVSSNGVYLSATQGLGGVVSITNYPFKTGLGGNYYLEQSLPLINRGHSSADNWQLYHYTTATNHQKESNSIVDIGFHYPAPVDSDGDGLFDYQEDSNGNNSYDAGDWTDFTNPDTDGDDLTDGAEVNIHRTDPLDPDTDDDGSRDGAEVFGGTDPLDPASFLTTISGNITHSGTQTGLIHITARTDTGLVVYLTFDQDTGTNIVDHSGHTNSGSAYGGASWTTNGYRGGGFFFDGTNDYIRIPYSASLNPTQFTASAWVKLNETNITVDARGVFGRHQASQDFNSWWSFADSSYIRGQLWNSSGTSRMISGLLHPVAQKWGLVTLTYDGSTLRFFVNTNQISASSITGYIGNGLDLLVGAGEYTYFTSSPDRFWHGWIDDVRLYNRALSTNEIKLLITHGTTITNTYRATIDAPDAYTITNVPNRRMYAVVAWRDPIGNFAEESSFAKGSYTGNSIRVHSPTAHIDISLVEPDSDGDGLSDFDEIYTYDTDPHDSASYVTTLSGQISYAGFQTGLIHVVASYNPHQMLYLSFDQNNGTNVIDQSGHTNNGAAYGGAVWTTNGYRGGAFYFDGTNDYLRIPFSPSYNRTQFTASAWIKLNETNVTVAARGILGRHQAGVNSHSWWTFADGAGLRGQMWGSGGSSGMITTNLAAVAQQWGFVTLTYDGSQLKFYTNATLIKSLSVTEYAGNVLDLLVGAGEYSYSGSSPDRFWHGWIDDVRMNKKALTGSEITNLFLTGTTKSLYAIISNAGPYTISNVPTKNSYLVEAWRDSNGSLVGDPPEAQGVYSNNLVIVTAAVSNIDVTLTDLDTDGDGMPDWWEWQYGFDPFDDGDMRLDRDNDGAENYKEFLFGTNPDDPDTDGDGMPDGWEILYSLAPLNPADSSGDSDNDGLENLIEYALGTNPSSGDTDRDRISDGPLDPDGAGPVVAGPDTNPTIPAPLHLPEHVTPDARHVAHIGEDALGRPTIVWLGIDNRGLNQLYAFKWFGTAPETLGQWAQLDGMWECFGNSGSASGIVASTSGVYECDADFDTNGWPTVAWTENRGSGKNVYAVRWQTNQWAALGGSFSGSGISGDTNIQGNPSVAQEPDGCLSVAWEHAVTNSMTNGLAIQLRRWSQSSQTWLGLGSSTNYLGLSATFGVFVGPQVAVGTDLLPVVSYWAITNWGKTNEQSLTVHARKWNGSSTWNPLATTVDGTLTNSSFWPDLYIGNGNTPQIGWIEYISGSSLALWVRQYTNSVWSGYGSSDSGTGLATGSILTIIGNSIWRQTNGNVGASWSQTVGGDDYAVFARLWNGSAWRGVGTTNILTVVRGPGYRTSWTKVTASKGSPVIVYAEKIGPNASDPCRIVVKQFVADSDGDGLSDIFENANGLDSSSSDSDGDGISDGLEWNFYGTIVTNADSDADGLTDGEEVNGSQWGVWSNPLNPDTDGDGIQDDCDPFPNSPVGDSDGDGIPDDLDSDDDNDGWSDSYETGTSGTDPLNPDSDCDGIPDSLDTGGADTTPPVITIIEPVAGALP